MNDTTTEDEKMNNTTMNRSLRWVLDDVRRAQNMLSKTQDNLSEIEATIIAVRGGLI